MDESKFFYTSNQEKLCGILSKANDNRSIVIMCHGLNSTKEESGSFTELSNYLNSSGINTFRFDFIGHGESEGDTIDMTIEKEKINLKSTLDMLIAKGFYSIIVLGASFGGGIVSLMDYKDYDQVKGILLWYPALTYKNGPIFNQEQYQIALEQGFYLIKSTRSQREMKLGLEVFEETKDLLPYKNLYNFNKPILIVHGDIDTITPINFSKEVANKISFCKLKTIEGGQHGFPNNNRIALNNAIMESYQFIKEII